jgi:hypothetical protein
MLELLTENAKRYSTSPVIRVVKLVHDYEKRESRIIE